MTSVKDVIESVAARHQIDVEEVSQTKAGSRLLLRVVVDGDGPDGRGLSLDDVAAVSRQISQALDDSDAMGDRPYVLEVGTRGVDRPLTKPAHWRRNVGRLVRVTRRDGDPLTARIESATEQAVTLSDGLALSYAEVVKAQVQVDLHAEMNRDNEEDEE